MAVKTITQTHLYPAAGVNAAFAYLSDMQLFTRAHPAIYRIAPVPGGSPGTYIFYEKLGMPPLAISFSYAAQVTVNLQTHTVRMYAKVFGMAEIDVSWQALPLPGGGTQVTETLTITAPFPLHIIAANTIKNAHLQMLQNIEKLLAGGGA